MKFFLIILLLSYAIYRFGGFLSKIIMVGRDITGETQQHKTTPKGSNVHVDRVPREQDKGKGYKGGEYVDYEEVS